jgi:Flp pilus assembly protein TadD
MAFVAPTDDRCLAPLQLGASGCMEVEHRSPGTGRHEMDEDEPTARMDLEAALRAQRTPAEQTPLVGVTGPLARPPASPSSPAKLGVALFVLGVLVGVGAAVAVMTGRADPTPGAAALSSSAPTLSSVLATSASPFPTSEPARLPLAPASKPNDDSPTPSVDSAVTTQVGAARTEAPEPAGSPLPVSKARAPSCHELLGEPAMKHQNAKAAVRETLLAKRLLVLGNVAMAHAAYCNAFALDRSNVDRHVNLARLYLVRRDWEKAAELAQSALKLTPKHRGALGVLADAWAALNKRDEARTVMLAAENKPHATPRELHLLVERNVALAKRVARVNDFLLAERLYRRALLVEPRRADAISGVARCLLKAGDVRAAEAWARQAKQLKGIGQR